MLWSSGKIWFKKSAILSLALSTSDECLTNKVGDINHQREHQKEQDVGDKEISILFLDSQLASGILINDATPDTT